jgi:hypothetical protein
MGCHRAAALLAVALAGCAHAGPGPGRPAPGIRLAVDSGERGEVTFQVPAGWKATSGEPEPPLPGSVRFEPPAGRLVLVVTPLWGSGEPGEPVEPQVARALVEAARDRALEGAVEGDLPIRPLPSPGLVGWYFAATDRELVESGRTPGPDEYRCLVQGVALAGPLLLAFSLLDDGDVPQREAALALVTGASHRPAQPHPPGDGEPARRDDTDPSAWGVRDAEPLELGLPGSAWSLLLDLPGWRVARPVASAGGQGISVVGRRPSDGLILSAALLESTGPRSAEACRAGDWARIEKLEGVGDARLEASTGEARAWYTVRDEGPATRHLSAWRYRGGTCIHLHLSLPAAGPGTDASLENGLGAARYLEAL